MSMEGFPKKGSWFFNKLTNSDKVHIMDMLSEEEFAEMMDKNCYSVNDLVAVTSPPMNLHKFEFYKYLRELHMLYGHQMEKRFGENC